MKVVVVGGGTAGHVVPAKPVIDSLLQAGDEVTFVGTSSGLEAQLTADWGVAYVGISAGKLRRYWSWQNVVDVVRIGMGLVQALWLLVRIRPQVVFSKGGFVSFPVVLAAWVLRIPVVAHESDATPGLANRLAGPFVRRFCTSFAATQQMLGAKAVHSGTPIRREILSGDPVVGRARFDLPPQRPLLVVTGGSLGADRLNQTVWDALPALLDRYAVVHVCGPGKLGGAPEQPGYFPLEYVGAGWGDILAAADVIVSRAGANALFELLALGKPNILIPLSARASRGDQIQNAAYAESQGYSLVLQDDTLDAEQLLAALAALDANALRAALQTFRAPDAARIIVEELRTLARR